MAAWARETGVILRFIEYMDVGHSNGWRLDEVVPAAELDRDDPGALAGRAGRRRRIAARSPTAGATSTARGEFGVISSVTTPFCGDCTRARLSAEGKLYTCLFAVDGHDVRARLRGGASRRGASRVRRAGSGRAATTATRSCARARRPRRCPRSRCSRWAADGRAVSSTACPQPSPNFVDTRTEPSRGTWWITALTRPPRPARTVGLARRGRQERRNRDRIKDLRSAAGRFGRFVARLGWLSHHGPPAGFAPDGT